MTKNEKLRKFREIRSTITQLQGQVMQLGQSRNLSFVATKLSEAELWLTNEAQVCAQQTDTDEASSPTERNT